MSKPEPAVLSAPFAHETAIRPAIGSDLPRLRAAADAALARHEIESGHDVYVLDGALLRHALRAARSGSPDLASALLRERVALTTRLVEALPEDASALYFWTDALIHYSAHLGGEGRAQECWGFLVEAIDAAYRLVEVDPSSLCRGVLVNAIRRAAQLAYEGNTRVSAQLHRHAIEAAEGWLEVAVVPWDAGACLALSGDTLGQLAKASKLTEVGRYAWRAVVRGRRTMIENDPSDVESWIRLIQAWLELAALEEGREREVALRAAAVCVEDAHAAGLRKAPLARLVTDAGGSMPSAAPAWGQRPGATRALAR